VVLVLIKLLWLLIHCDFHAFRYKIYQREKEINDRNRSMIYTAKGFCWFSKLSPWCMNRVKKFDCINKYMFKDLFPILSF